MATRNRTILYRKYRDVLKSVRVPSSSSPSSSSGGPVIELSMASLLNPNRNYAPLSSEDPGGYRLGWSGFRELSEFRSKEIAVHKKE
ncbi:syntaxin of plants 41 [Actinidia rufa]|uniref:Syntaxin of plants 41 n=1 Tax=Actinidia rufa TaxID=165716 RepID=A0A7J0F887_9ERIC|nr:syntaxin of plants 41 [Actinidia rufa]